MQVRKRWVVKLSDVGVGTREWGLLALSVAGVLLGSSPLATAGQMNPLIFDEVPQVGSVDVSGIWDGYNNPKNLSQSYERRFSQLPLAAMLPEDLVPWTDTYWPSNQGSISQRWFVSEGEKPRGWGYRLFRKEELQRMSRDQLAKLSPAEKYDIYVGNYQYRLTKNAWGSASPGAPDWAGICNGWSRAAIHHAEPQPVDVVNPDGIVIPFGSSDIKGLMSYYYAMFGKSERTHMLGKRCNRGTSSSNCTDVNAGALHIVLANQIGLLQESFMADVDPFKEVWNNPVYQYESHVVGESGPTRSSARGTVKRVKILTKMTFTEEIDPPQWEALNGTPGFKSKTDLYHYWLELSATGEILGGEWVSGSKRPDFLWIKEAEPFTGYYEALTKLAPARR